MQKRIGDHVQKNLRLDRETAEKLEQIAADLKLYEYEVIAMLVDQYVPPNANTGEQTNE